MAYVELHARSAFSFLRGASNPEDLAKTASALELPAIALLDRDGVYGAPRLFAPARENGIRAIVGAEITMEDGSVLPLIAASRRGYQNLCQLITETKLTKRSPSLALQPSHIPSPRNAAGPASTRHDPTPFDRKRPCFATWDELARYEEGLIALTGDEEGPIRRAWRHTGTGAVQTALDQLRSIFGPDRLYVEIQRHLIRGEERENALLIDLAAANKLPLLATGGVMYATRSARAVADVFTCLRHHGTFDTVGQFLSVNDNRHLKSAAEMETLFADLPEALAHSGRLAEQLEFTLQDLGYKFPDYRTPNGESMDKFLRDLTFASAREKFSSAAPSASAQLNRELELIARLGFSGYFLIVWDICRWARERGILVQGRGSAANSSVCYVLGITAVDPLKHRLLFDRFLNDSRVGADGKPSWPDIDLDFPSGARRESVIQEIYKRYGRNGAAMTANVITYRGRSIVREVGKVLGFGEDTLDRFSNLYANGDFPQTIELRQQLAMSGLEKNHPRAATLAFLYDRIKGLPRHLGQHSGGLVICQNQLDKVVPLENATMPDRSVCQWDKDDCENLGIVKVDFLGLGMMAVMQDTIELCRSRHPNGPHALNDIPPEDKLTYDKICAADTIGVFQIESRAQMSTLPRFKPRNLYDLAMQVAIIRPGPITGNLVHPLIRRRDGKEKDDYIDPSVEDIVKPILARTRGVILFQEQMLELSMKLAHFTGAEAEELRRAMGFTKNTDRLGRAIKKLEVALEKQGYNDRVIKKVVSATTSFAAYGFPESHAIGFAMLAYSSTWLKLYRTAEFYASLLNNQPMGFYSPATLIQDGRRHGLKAHPVCIVNSEWICTVVAEKTIRIGLRFVKGVRESAVQQMLAARRERPFASMQDFLRRTAFTSAERRSLAAVGALAGIAQHRRAALWQVEAAWSDAEALLKYYGGTDATTPEDWRAAETGDPVEKTSSPLVPMSQAEEIHADFAGLDLTTSEHPMAMLRRRLPDVCPAGSLIHISDGQRVTIAGSVICRQRPGTAKGFVFVSLEDETGIANAIVVPDLFERLRLIITQEPALKITGKLQNVSGVMHVKAEQIVPLRDADLPAQVSYDFH